MPRYVAFLRGINLGKRRVVMSRLVLLFEEMGFLRVATFIASGNVIFDSRMKSSGAIEAKARQHLASGLGYEVDVFVRTLEAVAEIARGDVFAGEATGDTIIHVGFLHEELSAEVGRGLESIRTSADQFKVRGREYYWLCRTRTSESKVWTLPVVRALRLPNATLRNLTSLKKLVAQHAPGLP